MRSEEDNYRFTGTIKLFVETGDSWQRPRYVEPFDEDIGDWLEAASRTAKLRLEREQLMRDYDPERLREAREITENFCLVDCSFSYQPVKTRLEMLMGSNVVRLTDRKYMQKLMTRIRQDFETAQQHRVEERRTKELMRTKKMILDRLIPVQEAPPELRKYPLFQLYLYCDSIIVEKQTKRAPKKVRLDKSLYRLLYPAKGTQVEETMSDIDDIYMKSVYINGVQTMVPMSAEEILAIKRMDEDEKEINNGYILTQDAYEKLHFENDAIKQLRDTQSVEEMYVKAQEIVGILYSAVDRGRDQKVNQESPQEEKDTSGEDPRQVTPSGHIGSGDVRIEITEATND